MEVLKWKSPRPFNHYKQNTEEEIKRITKLATAANYDALKIHILTVLKAVKYASASAILLFVEPQNYPVIDIHVWKQLHSQAGDKKCKR